MTPYKKFSKQKDSCQNLKIEFVWDSISQEQVVSRHCCDTYKYHEQLQGDELMQKSEKNLYFDQPDFIRLYTGSEDINIRKSKVAVILFYLFNIFKT